MMTTVQILPTQSIFDFCLQTCGSIEVLFDVMKLNALKDLFVEPLLELDVRGVARNKYVVDFYAFNKIKPGTIDQDLLAQFTLDDFNNNDFNINDFG